MLRILMPANSHIDEYISRHEGIAKERLTQLHSILLEIMPEAEQEVSYQMPTFKLGRYNAFHFAAFKHHVSIFPSSYAIEYFAEKLKAYKVSKGTVQFQNNEPLPVDLIREIAIWRKQFMTDNPEKG